MSDDDLDLEAIQKEQTYAYCWARQRLQERIQELAAIQSDAQVAAFPYLSDKRITEVFNRMHKLIETAHRQWSWDELDRASTSCDMAKAALTELKGCMKQLGVPFVERMLP